MTDANAKSKTIETVCWRESRVLPLYLCDIVGTASIGVYSLATDKIVIIPSLVPLNKAEKFAEWLKVKLIHTSIGGSVLVGAFACANSHGIVLPNLVNEEEVKTIKSSFDGNVAVIEAKRTAWGNMVLANDHGAVADPRLKEPELKLISEALCVPVTSCEIAGLPYVGSLGVATNRGVIVHPLLADSERKILEDVFKVPVDVGTINCGIPYVGTGLIGNRFAAVAGSMTTGPETFIIEHALDIVHEGNRN